MFMVFVGNLQLVKLSFVHESLPNLASTIIFLERAKNITHILKVIKNEDNFVLLGEIREHG